MKRFSDRVFYEIYPTSFCDSNGDGVGDLKGIESKLNYISDLGFNGIWLNPIYKSPFKDGGYDVEDFYEIDKKFGTMDDLKSLIKSAHDLDIKIILDLVPGHLSVNSKEFIKSSSPIKNEYSDLFIWTDSVWNTPSGKYISGQYDRDGAFMVNFFAHQAAINYGFRKGDSKFKKEFSLEDNPGRDYILKVIMFYLDMGIDGFRVDMADSLVKDEDDKEKTIVLWNDIFDRVRKVHKEAFFVSEWSNPNRSLRAGFDSDFILDHYNNCLHILFREEKPLLKEFNKSLYKKFIKDLKWRIAEANKFNANLSFISGNHDTYRIADYLSKDELKLAYIFILTMPGVPFVYAGDELMQMTDRSLLSKDGGYHRTGVRTPMAFDDEVGRGFTSNVKKSYLPLDERTISVKKSLEDEGSLLNLIKLLIKLRKENHDLEDGDFKLLDKPFAYRRGKIIVFINLLDEDQSIEVKTGDVLYSTSKYEVVRGKIVIAAHQAIIYKEV